MKAIIVTFLVCWGFFSWAQKEKEMVSGILDGVYLVEQPYVEWHAFDSLMRVGQPNKAHTVLEGILEKSIQHEAEYNTIRAILSFEGLLRYLAHDEKMPLFHKLYQTTDKMQPHVGELARVILLKELMVNHWSWIRHHATDTAFVRKHKTYNFKQEESRTAFVFSELEAIRTNLENIYAYPFEPYFELLYENKEITTKAFTVMDFVGHQLIGMYSSIELINYVSSINDDAKTDYRATLLLNPNDFAALTFDVQSGLSHSSSIFQVIERMHQNNPEMLSEIYYVRLRYGLDYNKVEDVKEIWKNAAEFIGNSQYRSRFVYEQCRLLYEEGVHYDFRTNKTVEQSLKEAHALLENELKQFPESTSAKVMTTLKELIEAPRVNIQMQNYVYPKEDMPLKLTHRNIESLTIQVFTKPEDKSEPFTIRDYLHSDVAKLVHKQTIEVVDKKDYNFRTTELLLDGIKASGNYFVLVTPSDVSIENYFETDSLWNLLPRNVYAFNVTEIFAAARSTKEGFEVLVTDYKTGKPIKNARITIYPNRNRYVFDDFPARTGTTNNDGLYKTGIEKWFDYEVTYKGSKLKSSDSHYNSGKPKNVGRIHVLTDRAIYRPGQTVYFKAIAYEGKNNDFKVVSNANLTLTVKNASWQEIYTTTLKTNDFGAIDGDFVLPQSGPLGNFRIEVAYEKDKNNYQTTNKSIRVEEYKRPTFEVNVNQPESAAQLNDTVHFSGEAKAFAGFPISGAKVEITIYRKWSTYWRFGGGGSTRDLVRSFDTLTNEQGQFSASFFAPEASLAPDHAYYTFEVEVKVTDVSGETHAEQLNIPLNKSGLALVYNGTTSFRTLTEHYASYQVTNLFGKEQAVQKVVVNVYEKEISPQFEARIWSKAEFPLYDEKAWRNLFPYEQSDEQNFRKVHLKKLEINSGDSLLLNDVVGNKQGNYILEAFVVTEKGDTLSLTTPVEVIEINQKKLPVPQPLWTYLSRHSATVGQAVEFQVGSIFDNGRVLVRLENGNGVIEEKWLDTKQRQKWCYVIQEEDRGNIAFSALIIQDGKRYFDSKTVSVPFENKKLHIKKGVFRDELLPGSEEKWTFTISGEEAEKIGADLCMGMYDASLDQFVNHSWGLWPYRSSYLYANWSGPSQRYASVQNGMGGWWDNASNWNRDDRKYRGSRYYNSMRNLHLSYTLDFYDDEIRYDLNEVKVMAYEAPLINRDGGASGERSKQKEYSVSTARNQTRSSGFKSEDFDDDVEEEMNEPTPPSIQIRENFNETAFFYPSLQINEAGEYEVAFTLPESLTQWKLFGLAHTKDLQIGSLQLDAQAKKDLMITANAPRFFRQGDQFDFSAKVVNLTATEQVVDVELSFLNPITNQPIVLTGEQATRKQVAVPANSSAEVLWELNIAIETGVVAYKIVVFNENYSDGEQKPIPVLTNRQLVTEAMPFILAKEGTTQLNFDALKNKRSSTLKQESLTFEFTGNIAWNAVLALPYLAEYPYECSEQLFARYFANALAANLIASKPKIKAVFDTWRMDNPEVFASQLEKNSELKSIILEETPWVLQAKNEAARNARLAQLFELNQLANGQRATLNKLTKQQNRDGSFGWFGGNRANIYITQHLVAGFGQLQALGITLPKEAEEMSKKALNFLNAYYVSEYKKREERKEKPITQIDNLALMWLYASAYFPANVDKDVLHVRNVYDSLLVANWKKLGLQQQAMAGMYFVKNGNEKMANMLAASFRDRAKQTQQQGMYFPENNGGRYWNQRKIETHALITAFLAEVGTAQTEIDALRLWLFLHKQRNAWESTKATTTAVYALLAHGTDYLENDNLPTITVGKEQLVYTQTENPNERHVNPTPGLGYIKTTWHGSEISPEQATVSITKTDATPSVGALYWQYFEDMDKITQSSNAQIQIVKTYQRVQAGTKGDELVADSLFKRGDRVRVTLTVVTQQELEFVHLKDLRPAGFEPVLSLSSHQSEQGLWYYQSPRDVSMNYFIDYLPQGSYTFTYDLFVNSSGTFNTGSASIQCMYAPEFVGNSGGMKLKSE